MTGMMHSRREPPCCNCYKRKCMCKCHPKSKLEKAELEIRNLKEMVWLMLIIGFCIGGLIGSLVGLK